MMPNFAVIDADGLIVNRIVLEADADYAPDNGYVLIAEPDGIAYDIGGTVIAGIYAPPQQQPLPPPLVPASISDRQFFQQLAVVGTITTGEALAAVKTGDIPAALQGFVDALPDDEKFAAEMLLSGATIFERNFQLTEAIGAAQGMSADQIDDFFRAAADL